MPIVQLDYHDEYVMNKTIKKKSIDRCVKWRKENLTRFKEYQSAYKRYLRETQRLRDIDF